LKRHAFFLEGVPFGLAEALQAWSVGHLGLLQFMGLAQEAVVPTAGQARGAQEWQSLTRLAATFEPGQREWYDGAQKLRTTNDSVISPCNRAACCLE